MKWVKRFLWIVLVFIIGASIWIGRFIYKAKVGFTYYETETHDITIPKDRPAILVISKTTGFRHEEAISASQPMFDGLGKRNDWFVYLTEDAGIFNEDQLKEFEVIVWNNATGSVLNESQQFIFKSYLENGGGFVGIHAAGDGSHKWQWYRENIICADFSHHPFKNQFQSAKIQLIETPDSTWNVNSSWEHTDEWYIFTSQPSEKGAKYLYTIDGDKIDPDGNILWMKQFDFGMGKIHPVAWYKNIEKGRSFYTSIGHTKETFSNPNFNEMITQAIQWTGRINDR